MSINTSHCFIIIHQIYLIVLQDRLKRISQIHEFIWLYNNPLTMTRLSCTRITRNGRYRNLQTHGLLCYYRSVFKCSLVYITFCPTNHTKIQCLCLQIFSSQPNYKSNALSFFLDSLQIDISHTLFQISQPLISAHVQTRLRPFHIYVGVKCTELEGTMLRR